MFKEELQVDPLLFIALLAGIAVVIGVILWTRLDAFPALLLGAVTTGLIAGVAPLDLVAMITTGFGNTLASIGIVIGLGVALGKILEVSGAADAIARWFIKSFGENREANAMAATGAIVSVPVFCDTGYVMLHPLARSLASRTGKSLVMLSIALGGGLVLAHTLVPPTPGPLAVAGLLGVDLGQMLLIGGAYIILLLPVLLIWARYMGPKLEPHRDDSMFHVDEMKNQERPEIGVLRATIPLIVPIGLIIFNTVSTAVAPDSEVRGIASFLGAPPVALLIGLIIAVYLLPQRDTPRKTVIGWLGEAAATGGFIIFITGAGGAFANVLNQSGVGQNLAAGVGQLPLPLFLVPFIIASVVRVAQGSGTVAMITAATLAVPLVEAGQLNAVLAALAASSGAFLFSHVNDSFFWVTTKFAGVSGIHAIKMWSGTTTVIWVATIPLLFATWLIMGAVG